MLKRVYFQFVRKDQRCLEYEHANLKQIRYLWCSFIIAFRFDTNCGLSCQYLRLYNEMAHLSLRGNGERQKVRYVIHAQNKIHLWNIMCDRNRTEILAGNTRKYITDIWARTHFVVIIFRIRYTKINRLHVWLKCTIYAITNRI